MINTLWNQAMPIRGWKEQKLLQRELGYVCGSVSSKFEVRYTDSAFCWLLTGKTVTLARTMDIPRAVQNFRFFASSILHHTSECTQMDHLGCLHYTVRAPAGIGRCCAMTAGPQWHREVLGQPCRSDRKEQTLKKRNFCFIWNLTDLKNLNLVYFVCVKFPTYPYIVLEESQGKKWHWE